jgi:predicted RNA-binding Zn ribbon-like protein
MNFSHYKDLTVTMAVDLVNTRNPVDGTDELTTVAELEGFLAGYERDWHSEDWHPGRPTDKDLEAARKLREQLRSVFDSADDHEAADRLNAILADAVAVPRISTHSAAPHFHFEPRRGGTAEWLAVAAAMGLGVALVEGGLERFGSCGAHDCVDVFVDTSKNRSRSHCSTRCATRENVAAYRKRARAAGRP